MPAMPTRQQTNAVWRYTIALFAVLGAIAAFATATSAGAPQRLPSQARPASTTSTPSPSPSPTGCIQVWNVVDSPNPYSSSSNELNGVAAVSSTDVWAVGTGMIQHWDGSIWTAMTSTVPLTPTTGLFGVSAASANDVWAVGRGDGAGHYTGVILHWDGSSWSYIPNPDPQDETGLFGVNAISANDVWAVGYRNDYSSSDALTMHWDGSTWSIVPTPAPPSAGYHLFAVSAIATNDVWAVGWTPSGVLMMHWDGTAWSISPGTFSGELFGVVAITHNDIWASGSVQNGSSYNGLIFHWDGTSWTLSTTVSGDVIYRVSATSSDDVWAVGRANGTLVMHWDGNTWTRVSSPIPYPFAGELWDVAAISPTEVWAVGDANPGAQSTTLTIRYTQWCPPPVVCTPGWSAIQGPNPGPDTNYLFGIATIASDDIWAVGAFDPGQGMVAQHWNGSYWSLVPVSGVPGDFTLRHVTAISSNDVWAVGWTYGDTDGRHAATTSTKAPGLQNRDGKGRVIESPQTAVHTVTAHWDGQSWTRIPSPNPDPTNQDNALYGVGGVSSSDVWAVGTYHSANGSRTLQLHWDGTTWTQIDGQAGTLGTLVAVAAIATNNVWAVGFTDSSGTWPLTMHWDGVQWSEVSSPLINGAYLTAIAAVSANDIWAVGYTANQPVTMHWDGTQWNVVSAPGNAQLWGVSAVASNDVWAVGSAGSAQATIMQWDGSAWNIVSHPTPGPGQVSELYDVAAVSAGEVWAVGDVGHYYLQTDIERYVASCETPSPAVSATATVTAATTVTDSHHSHHSTPATSTPSPTTVPTCVPGWSIVASPDQDHAGFLFGVSVLAANDVWAVGDFSTVNGRQTLVEHWDGVSWSVVPSANHHSSGNRLTGVAAISANDVWAVGIYFSLPSSRAKAQTQAPALTMTGLIEHWDGAIWSIVPNPDLGSSRSELIGITAVSANDVWAVGDYTNANGPGQTLVEHWNGTAWSIVPSANRPSTTHSLYAVAAVSANDVWAVGEYVLNDNSDKGSLVEHWDGTTWSIVPSPSQPSSFNHLYGISVVSASDVWAVGYYGGQTGTLQQTLVEHWDGASWSIVPSPNQGPSDNYLSGVAAISASDVWAVGYYVGDTTQPLEEHWDGTAWSVYGPSPGMSYSDTWAVAAVSTGDIWAVGAYEQNNQYSLTEHYAICSSTPTATASTCSLPAAPPPQRCHPCQRHPCGRKRHTSRRIPTGTDLPARPPPRLQ